MNNCSDKYKTILLSEIKFRFMKQENGWLIVLSTDDNKEVIIFLIKQEHRGEKRDNLLDHSVDK